MREKITVARLFAIDFAESKHDNRTIYVKGRFFIYPELGNWFYGLIYGAPEHGNLSHINFMDELIRIMGELGEG
jgi:hypothetical protein